LIGSTWAPQPEARSTISSSEGKPAWKLGAAQPVSLYKGLPRDLNAPRTGGNRKMERTKAGREGNNKKKFRVKEAKGKKGSTKMGVKLFRSEDGKNDVRRGVWGEMSGDRGMDGLVLRIL